MFRRRLGKSGIEINAMGLGCITIGGPWARTHRGGEVFYPGQVDENEIARAIHRALDLGVNFFDTAANYGAGRSERLLGRAIVGRRDKVVIATKFGYLVDEENNRTDFYGGDENSDEVAAHMRVDCEASLRRLGTDYIDLYQFHIGGYSPSKAARVRDMLEELVQEGKIRWYGWSTDNPEGARFFAQGKHCAAIQHELNVIDDAQGCCPSAMNSTRPASIEALWQKVSSLASTTSVSNSRKTTFETGTVFGRTISSDTWRT